MVIRLPDKDNYITSTELSKLGGTLLFMLPLGVHVLVARNPL